MLDNSDQIHSMKHDLREWAAAILKIDTKHIAVLHSIGGCMTDAYGETYDYSDASAKSMQIHVVYWVYVLHIN